MEDINLKQLTLAVRAIAEEKNLPEETVLSVIEQAIAAAWRRDNGEREQNVRAELNTVEGTAKVFVIRTVVEEVENPVKEISLDDAKKIKPEIELGDVIEDEHEVTSFGRVAAQTAKQVVLQRLREAERDVMLSEFEDKIGTMVTGIVQRVEPRVVRIELGKASGILPQSEQIQGERYSVGSRIKVLIKDIERALNASDLGITPASDGSVIRLVIPALTEETRRDLAKEVKKVGENAKIAIRNIRRDAMDEAKKQEKAKEITEDELKGLEKDIQKVTDDAVKHIDEMTSTKEKELLEV